MRTVQSFNDGWLFAADKVSLAASDDLFEAVTLPIATNSSLITILITRNISLFPRISTYHKQFSWTQQPQGRHVFLDFDGMMLVSTIYLNGKLLGEHRGGYGSFSIDMFSPNVGSEL